MALKDLVSDLSNFRYGISSPDKLDGQINKGVDFFPDDASGAEGFTPKTNLESRYNKFMKDVRQNNNLPNQYDGKANITAPNAGVRINDKTRSAYGSQGEYSEPAGVGISKTNHILSSDTILGVRLQPQFTSDFMTTPIADYVSMFSKPYDSEVYNVQQHLSSGPTQFNVKDFDNTPQALDAHGSDFMTTPIASYISGFAPPSNLSQTFSLAISAGEKVRFNYWKTFSAIGGSADKFAGLIPSTTRISQFSFPERDRENNIDVNPNGFSGLKTTFNLPRESWRYSTTNTNDVFNDTFSTLGLGSSNYTDIIDSFHKYSGGDFVNLPGLGSDNKFFNRSLGEGGKFRNVADPTNLIHPIILRPFGSNWKDAGTDLQIPDLKFSNHQFTFNNALGLDGFSLSEMSARNIADNSRLEKWALTPQGASFIDKQFSLQRLNPTIETKQYKRDSFLGVAGNLGETTVPVFHPERHVGGFATRYENVLNISGFNPEPGIQFTGGSRLAYQSRAFTIDIPPIPQVSGGGLLGTVANLAIGALNAVVSTAAASIAIGLSSPNRYSPFPSAAPISTRLGYVAFGSPLAMTVVDTLIAQNRKGGTFNKDTAKSTKTGIKRHHTLDYSKLTKALSYEGGGRTGGEWDEKVEGLMQEKLLKQFEGKEINDMVGKQGQTSDVLPKRSDEFLGIIKGNRKSSNVDKLNIMPIVESGDPQVYNNKDFVKFRFKDMVNGRFIIFRAILDGITDAVVPEYGEEKYIGRPNKVFVYQGAERTVNFNFTIYPKTKQELPILIQKLEYLVSLCYPSYTEQNFMKTPFIALTLGDMFVDAPGVLSGLTVTVEDQSTWELDEGLQFPHFIKAQCEFKYIGQRKLKTGGIHYDLGETAMVRTDSGELTNPFRDPLPPSVSVRETQTESRQ